MQKKQKPHKFLLEGHVSSIVGRDSRPLPRARISSNYTTHVLGSHPIPA